MSEQNWPFWGLRDPVSCLTHLVAFVWSIYATLLLWRLCRGQGTKQLGMLCFGLSMMVLYAASSTYHAVLLPPEQVKFFQLLDLSAIYVLIAGTYTPAFLVLLRDRPSKRLFLIGIWILALVGIACKWLLPKEPYWLTLILYFGLGYSGLLYLIELGRVVGVRGMQWVFYGGICYTLGGAIDFLEYPNLYPGVFGFHELFHLCAMAGTFSHFMFMVHYVVPFPCQRVDIGVAPALPGLTTSLSFADTDAR